MANQITKKDVKERLAHWKEEGFDLNEYSQIALVMAYLLGMTPKDCENMDYPEEDDQEMCALYDKVDNLLWDIKKEKPEQEKASKSEPKAPSPKKRKLSPEERAQKMKADFLASLRGETRS